MFNFESDRTPTKRELENRYRIKIIDGKFPFCESSDCCGVNDPYISDFITHRHGYHKMPMKEVMVELDQFMSEIYQRHQKCYQKSDEELK